MNMDIEMNLPTTLVRFLALFEDNKVSIPIHRATDLLSGISMVN